MSIGRFTLTFLVIGLVVGSLVGILGYSSVSPILPWSEAFRCVTDAFQNEESSGSFSESSTGTGQSSDQTFAIVDTNKAICQVYVFPKLIPWMVIPPLILAIIGAGAGMAVDTLSTARQQTQRAQSDTRPNRVIR